MLFKHLIDMYDILDSKNASGEGVATYLRNIAPNADVTTYVLEGPNGKTDMLKVKVAGLNGKKVGGIAPTIGLLGRLGGLGVRPDSVGFVSDGDGALVTVALAAELLSMQQRGDFLQGDVFLSTHICPNAPIQPHHPVAFMGSPVDMAQVNKEEVSDELDAILCVDTTKGNKIYNKRGFAISPTVKEGYILKVSNDLLDIMEITTGELPGVFALSTQDITPYGNDLYHLNSILQPSTATGVPVVGVAITSQTMVPGCATGASHITDMEEAGRYMLEVAKAFGENRCEFYDKQEYEKITKLYGRMTHLQTLGNC